MYVTTIIISVCHTYLGMKSDDIPNGNIKASSTYSQDFEAYKARLNSFSPWWAEESAVEPWIQADLGYQTHVSGLITQGDGGFGDNADWITSFKISTFEQSLSDGEVFIINGDGSDMVSAFL